MELDRDPQQTMRTIAACARQVKAARNQLHEYCEHWHRMCALQFSGIAEFQECTPEDQQIAGSVLGKKFQIRTSALIEHGAGLIEALLFIEGPSNQPQELLRFKVSQEGSISCPIKGMILSGDATYASYSLMSEIVRAVAEAPFPRLE